MLKSTTTLKVISVASVISLALFAQLAAAQTYDANGNLISPASNSANTTTNTSNSTLTPATNASGTTSSTSGTTGTTPGVPNTGAGGNAAENMMVLVASGVAALAGILYLSRRAMVRE